MPVYWNYLGLSNRSISGIDFSTSSIVACGSGVFQSTNNGSRAGTP